MILGNESLNEYYTTMHKLINNSKNKITLSEYENMIVYERDIFLGLLIQDINEENSRLQNK